MSGLSTAAEAKVLGQLFGKTAMAEPATWYLALFTALPTDAGGGTECTGGSYARVAVTNNTTSFPVPSGGSPSSVVNGAAITFPSPTAAWGIVVGFGWYDASSGGTLWAWAPLLQTREINNGDAAPSFAAGELAATLD